MKFIVLFILTLSKLWTYLNCELILFFNESKDAEVTTTLPDMLSLQENDENFNKKIILKTQQEHLEYKAYELLLADIDAISHLKNEQLKTDWIYFSNMTQSNLNEKIVTDNINREYIQEIIIKLLNETNNWEKFQSSSLRRQIKIIKNIGDNFLSKNDYTNLKKSIANMWHHYNHLTFCSYTNINMCNLTLYPHINAIISKSEDPDELKYYWIEWYNKSGKPLKPTYITYVNLKNKAAKLNNFTSAADEWDEEFTDKINIREKLHNIFDDIHYLYKLIHGYVRYRLYKKYGKDNLSMEGKIPLHLLGNMWGQSWAEISRIVLPYPNKILINITDEMIKQGYKPLKIVQMVDEYFQSLNMIKLPQQFWNYSIIEKPNDNRSINCYPPSAWKFYNINDVRIKQCTEITMNDFLSTYKLLGQIQYYLQYQNITSYLYRKPANIGIENGFSDAISLSISTPKYLKRIGLLNNQFILDDESRINQLFQMALDKIIFLPFAFSLDLYRHMFFRDKIQKSISNCEFWYLRGKYSGIEPPIIRTENDFDPPAKFHAMADIEYMGYFIGSILQFQFYKSACEKARQYEEGNPDLPLDNCDLYGSADAGNAFKSMLSLGASKPWPYVIQAMTGEQDLSAKALLEYFKPLQIWLENEIKRLHIHIGWPLPNECDPSLVELEEDL